MPVKLELKKLIEREGPFVVPGHAVEVSYFSVKRPNRPVFYSAEIVCGAGHQNRVALDDNSLDQLKQRVLRELPAIVMAHPLSAGTH